MAQYRATRIGEDGGFGPRIEAFKGSLLGSAGQRDLSQGRLKDRRFLNVECKCNQSGSVVVIAIAAAILRCEFFNGVSQENGCFWSIYLTSPLHKCVSSYDESMKPYFGPRL